MGKNDNITSFLGAETSYSGQLNFTGTVHIAGQFTGEIKSEGTLVLEPGAKVEGTIHVHQLMLSGQLDGDVVVTGKCTIRKSAHLTGNLITKALSIEEGAYLQGSISMDPERVAMASENPLGKGAATPNLKDLELQ